MAELFRVAKSGISRHPTNVYDTEGLLHEATVAKFAIVRMECGRRIYFDELLAQIRDCPILGGLALRCFVRVIRCPQHQLKQITGGAY